MRKGIFLFSFSLALSLWGAPTGFFLESGEAEAPTASGGQFVVESRSNACIAWDSFSIGPKESVVFQQASSEHYVLNQVKGSSESSLLGSLRSNGSVYLINPNGIFIGPDAHIETGGFLASTLDLCKEALGKGELRFLGSSEKGIVHQGSIRASKEVYLVARSVDLRGEIEAGKAGVFAGFDLWIERESGRPLWIRPGENGAAARELLEENPYALAIRQSGSIRAKEISLFAPEIAVEGRLDASGEGGVIEVRGETVSVARSARLCADAKRGVGDGGEIRILGGKKASFFGEISSRGGEAGGNGGFVEVSAPLLEYRGTSDLRAPFGDFGELLLDPSDVVISTGASSGGVDLSTNPATLPGDNTVTINTTDLNNQLQLSHVTITTVGTGGTGPNGGSITISNPIGASGAWSANTTLTLTAVSYIAINAAVTNTSASAGFTAMDFTANGTGALANAGIALNSGGVLTTTGGAVLLNGTSDTDASAVYGVRFNSGSIVTGSGSVTITGAVSSGAAGAGAAGIYMGTTNGIQSASGTITLTGTTAASSSGSYGVRVASSWNTAGAGLLSFDSCTGSDSSTASHAVNLTAFVTHGGNLSFVDCVGGNNSTNTTSGGYGLSITGGGTITGNVTGTGIQGRGGGGIGFSLGSGTFTVSGADAGIDITASATGTAGSCHGISLSGGQIRTTGGGNLVLNGTGGASNAASHGIHLVNFAPPRITTATGGGNISLTGTASGSASSIGIYSQMDNPITSSTGDIFFSGSSSASGSGSHGVLIGRFTSGSTGTWTFQDCSGGAASTSRGVYFLGSPISHLGDLALIDCTGGSVGTDSTVGVEFQGTTTIGGNITGTGIVGLLSDGFRLQGTLSAGGSIDITAESTATASQGDGIDLTSGQMNTTGGGSITLRGTGGPSSSTSHGIQIAGSGSLRISTATGGGDITLIGTSRSSSNSQGIQISSPLTDPIVSSTGDITLTGAATGNGSGCSIFSTWNTGSSGTLTFIDCVGGGSGTGVTTSGSITHAGDIFFTDCLGGLSGSNLNGVNLGGAISTTGNILGTGLEARGSGGVGFILAANISTSGAGATIDITAFSSAVSGGSTGMSLQGGSIRTTGGGSITLHGTSGPTGGHGISITGVTPTSRVSTTTGNGDIFLTGVAQGSNSGNGIRWELGNSIASTSGNITLTGTTASSGSNSWGVNVNQAQNTLTTGSLTFLNCAGSANTTASHAVNVVASITHAGDLIFTNCVGGNNGTTGGNGVNFSSAPPVLSGNVVATGVQGQGNGGKGFASSVNFPVSGAGKSISITASATGTTGACHGIDLTAETMSTSGGGSITLHGTGGASSTASHGIQIAGGSAPRISTATGNGSISLTGIAQGSAVSHGIQWNLANSITSTSGNIALSGTTTASGNSSFGVHLAAAQDTATSGSLTFSNCAGSANSTASHAVQIAAALTHDGALFFTTCQGGANGTTGGNGVNITSAPTLGGSVMGTGIEGRGNGGIGFASSVNFTAGGAISLTASASGTSGACHGISLSSDAVISTTGSNALTLNGTGGASNTASYGINLTSWTVESASGPISLSGAGQGSAVSHGIQLGAADRVTSTSGDISLSGTTTASGNSSFGVHLAAAQDTATSGSLTFSNCAGSANSTASHAVQIAAALTHDGALFFTTCQGGANGTTGGNGVNITSAPTLGGSVTGTGIEGRGNGGIGFASSVNFTAGGAISLTASASGTSGACHGISLSSNAVMSSTGSNALTLSGAGGASNTASYGINLTSWTVESASGPISLSGAGQGSAVSHGIQFGAVDRVTSTSGNITLSGTTTASGNSSFGVNLAAAQDTATSGSLTFSNCAGSANSTASHAVQIAAALTHDGALFFTTCQGGANGTTGGNGVNITSAPTLGGSVTGTGIEGRGNGGIGFFSSTAFASPGSISLTASASGTSGACHGISMASGQTMSTSGGGSLALSGTGGPSSTASYGIHLVDWTVSTATGGGDVSLTGAARGDAVSHGVYLDATGAILTGTGDIAVAGSTTASGSGSFGVFLEMDLITEGGAVSVAGSTLLASSQLVDTTNGGAAAGGGNISFLNSIEGATAYSETLTLRAGSSGNISLSGSIGASTPLDALLLVSGDDITVSSTVEAASLTQSAGTGLTLFSEDVTLTGASTLTGAAFTLNGTWTTGGALTIDNASLLTTGTSSDFQLGGAFTQTGTGNVSLGGDITTSNDAIEFASPVSLIGSVSLDTQGAAGISFAQTLGGGFGLIATAGDVTFNGVVGAVPLTSLVVNADAISVYADQTVSTGPLTYNGPVALFANVAFAKTGSGAVTFAEGITGNYELAIEALSSTVSIAGTVDLTGAAGTGAAGKNCAILAGGNVTLGGEFLAQGASAAGAGGAGGSVEIASLGGSISLHNVYTFGGAGATTGVGGNITISPASTYTGIYPDGLLVLNEDLGGEGNLVATQSAVGAAGAVITLNAGRSSYPKVATITSSLAGNDVSLLGETITMGSNEVMTVLGDLTLDGYTMTLSDIVVLENLQITALDINLLQHGPVTMLLAAGNFGISPSLHWQSGGTYSQFGILNPPDGVTNSGTLVLPADEFLPLLTFESHILNYDGDVYHVPAIKRVPHVPIPTRQNLIYQLGVADAELSDMLPPLRMDSPKTVHFKRRRL